MKSMTGFSKTFVNIKDYGNVSIEIKTLNSKNININCKTPNELSYLEFQIRKLIRNYIHRGTITCMIKTDYSEQYIKKMLKKRYEILKNVFKDFENNDIMKFIISDFIENNTMIKTIDKKTEKKIFAQIQKTLKEVIKFRVKEGGEIRKEYDDYIKLMNDYIKVIEKEYPKSIKKRIKKLKQLIKHNDELMKENILLYADKIDISEEISRFKSHLKKLKKENKGTSLNFILQELLRETNTIGSKSESIIITNNVIKIKEIIEKMKEQVLNIE